MMQRTKVPLGGDKDNKPKPFQKLGRALQELHHDAVERRDERIAHRETVREQARQEVQRTSQPKPTSASSNVSQKSEQQLAFDKHVDQGNLYYKFDSWSQAIAEYDLALMQKNAQITMTTAMLGVMFGGAVLEDDVKQLYLKIAQCYMNLKIYTRAKEYLNKIEFFAGAKSMLAECNSKIESAAQNSARSDALSLNNSSHVSAPKLAATQTSAPITKSSNTTWLKIRHGFVETAKDLLTYTVDEQESDSLFVNIGPKKNIDNLQDFVRKIEACLHLFKDAIEPSEEEIDLCDNLTKLLTAVKIRQAEIDKSLAEMSAKLHSIDVANKSQLIIIDDMGKVQIALARGDYSGGLNGLRNAKQKLLDSFPQLMPNQELNNPAAFDEAIDQLSVFLNEYTNSLAKDPEVFATLVVDTACGAQRLFYQHRDRIVKYLKDALCSDWPKFYSISRESFKSLPLFHAMVRLIKEDLVTLDWNKYLGRGGIFDHLQLKHSSILGEVLAKMVELDPSKPYQVHLQIFAETETLYIAQEVPVATNAAIDWQASLEVWPKLVNVEATAEYTQREVVDALLVQSGDSYLPKLR